MQNGRLAKIAIVLVCGGCLLAAALPVVAQATTPGACTVAQAKRDLQAADQALHAAERRAKEARDVLSKTQYYSAHDYSDFAGRSVDPVPVGRWIRLARRSGWSWGAIDMLEHVIARESSGSPDVEDYAHSGHLGLLQLAWEWYSGVWHIAGKGRVFNPRDPAMTLYWGWRIFLANGWSPWSVVT